MKIEIVPGIDLTNSKIIHHSKKEKIYLTHDSRIIKICKNIDDCRREYLILKYCKDNKYFPQVYEYRLGYIIREYIDGICLIDYIKKYSLNESLALSLVDLIENFKALDFSRLDTGISHIFITKNGQLKVIGLKNNYTRKEKYPKHMISGLRKLKVSKKFFKILKKERPDLYEAWKS
ncbi:serine/threonine protein kinase [Clostridium sp. JNZ J1-5]